jgi:hypothetical protein
MKMRRRLLQSLPGGLVIPAVYYGFAVAVAFATHLVVGWDNMPEAVDRWLFFPIAWPELLYERLFVRDLFDVVSLQFILMLIGANFLLYASLTYAFLCWRERMKRLP